MQELSLKKGCPEEGYRKGGRLSMKKRVLGLRPPNKVRVHPMPCVNDTWKEGSEQELLSDKGANPSSCLLQQVQNPEVGENETKTQVISCLQDSQPWESVRTTLHMGQLFLIGLLDFAFFAWLTSLGPCKLVVNQRVIHRSK